MTLLVKTILPELDKNSAGKIEKNKGTQMPIVNGYASLADVKASARITDTVDDGLLELAVESASRLVDSYTQRYFYNAGTATRLFAPLDNYVTEIDDLISLSVLETSDGDTFGTTWDTTDYQLEPLNGHVDGLTGHPATRIRAIDDFLFNLLDQEATVRVTGVWGWSAVPTAVKQATVIQAARIFKRNDSPTGIVGFGDMGAVRVGVQLDPDVKHLIDVYRKVRFA
jgi:hypothetical protein